MTYSLRERGSNSVASAPQIDETHDPSRTSWVPSANGHRDFPVQNLPLGVFSCGGGMPRGGIAIGDAILDLAVLSECGLLAGQALDAARAGARPRLNSLLALGSGPRRALRRRVSELLSDDAYRDRVEPMLHDGATCSMHLPARVGDYTDFYVGIHHATNVGTLFRPDQPLLPNYKHVPIGYHGRASSVVVSGTGFRRPYGQQRPGNASGPVFGPSERIDYEVELGVWIGAGNALGDAIPIDTAFDAVAGITLLNDWSARDIQAWEYQPLGPFLAKNFLTSISPWIVTAEALAPFRIRQPVRPEGDPAPLPYLWSETDQLWGALSATIEAHILTAAMRAQGAEPFRLSHVHTSSMYWTFAQMIAHHTAGGCNLNPGDLLGTGTISGALKDGFGSLIEITAGGASSIDLPCGEKRGFLVDGDEVILTGRLEAPGYVSIGFGECRGLVNSAPPCAQAAASCSA